MQALLLPDSVTAGVYRSRLLYRNDGLTPPRTVTFFELELPLESAGVSYLDGGHARIRTDTVICAKPGQTRRTRLPYSCRYVHLRIGGGALRDAAAALPDFIPLSDPRACAAALEAIAELCPPRDESSLILQYSLILRLIYDLQREADRERVMPKTPGDEAVEKAIAYVREDLTRDLSLKAVAEEVSFSQSYLHTLFRKKTGKTLRTYVEDLRFRRSVELLTNTSLTLTQIAFECGFGSQSYYSSVFRKRQGCTPREYVKKMCEAYPLPPDGRGK